MYYNPLKLFKVVEALPFLTHPTKNERLVANVDNVLDKRIIQSH